ncbi:MAG: T9SS type A sorting domain-containing protein [Candidatus Pseudobacter hemicellulosilyticus]|uniref:T9SS type A sorting domain-containing protein n=1 Tax=Candidatus Pseudobacter hemicellulosilyticus TaxID=3121375 RepID=A0AAJ5WVJ5_9BACT|nr:MAG: T9SS type A sorting domain-containing protein [Pseudobacter sp.]
MQLRFLILSALTCLSVIQGQSQTCINGGTTKDPFSIFFLDDFTISGNRIFNESSLNHSGNCITLMNCNNVRIENCVIGPSAGEGIRLINCTNVIITNCYFMDNRTGILVEGGTGIKILNNQFLNIHGPFPRGQCVQFLEVNGAGNEISDNVSEQVPGKSSPEDLINLYKSHGTPLSHILVNGNKFRGGGPSQSGGGILAGDVGGDFQRLQNNILVDPGQYGIAIASGHYNYIMNNKVYGRQQSFTNTAYYAYNIYIKDGYTCGDFTVEGNESNYTNKNGQLIGEGYWGMPGTAEDCRPISGIANNNWLATFGPEILPARLLCPLLVAHYPLNNNFQDVSGCGHNISSNVGFSAEGKDIACGNFNGTNYLTLPNSPWLRNTSNRLSVSAWIKPAQTQGIQAIATAPDSDGYNDGWRLLLEDGTLNGRITTTLGSIDVYAAGIQAGAWNYVTMTYDGQQLKLYVNGVLSGSVNYGGNLLSGNYTAKMLVGYSRGTSYYFTGQLDEFKFYNGDLNAAEILQAYNDDRLKFEAPRQLLAHYAFNANWNDASGNNLHITNSGASFVCDGADALSANFNGSSLLTMPLNNSLKTSTSKFYLSCWIKPNVVQGVQAITHAQDADGYNNGWRLLLLDATLNGRVVTSWGAADVYCSGVQAGVWNHVALTYDGLSLKVFLNGLLQASTPWGGYLIYANGASQNMRIGYSNGNNYYFNGRMDEFRFYNGNITQEEVLDEYNTTLAKINNPPACPLQVTVQHSTAAKAGRFDSNPLNIYPNPAVSELFINAGTGFQAVLFNATGQRVWSGSDHAGQLRLHTRDIKPGVYFLQVSGKGWQETRKVMIQR